MTYKFTVPGVLPNLNDYVKAQGSTWKRGGRFCTAGNNIKRTYQKTVEACILKEIGRKHTDAPLHIIYHHYEPNRKRDKDNVASFAMKVIQDALVNVGFIDNDGWKNIYSFESRFDVDRKHPRIEVELREIY